MRKLKQPFSWDLSLRSNTIEFTPDIEPQRFDLIPDLPRRRQPHAGARAVFWQLLALHNSSYVVLEASYDYVAEEATLVVETPERDVREFRRMRFTETPEHAEDDECVFAMNLIWEMGASNRTRNIKHLQRELLSREIVQPMNAIPGCGAQADSLVRAAYWRARTLDRAGWKLASVGAPEAQGGFVAEINDRWHVFPASMRPDGTVAASLARLIPALGQLRSFDLESLLGLPRSPQSCRSGAL